jgi:hypothetical protein
MAESKGVSFLVLGSIRRHGLSVFMVALLLGVLAAAGDGQSVPDPGPGVCVDCPACPPCSSGGSSGSSSGSDDLRIAQQQAERARISTEANRKGVEAYRAGNYEAAISYFKEALKYYPMWNLSSLWHHPYKDMVRGNLRDAESALKAQRQGTLPLGKRTQELQKAEGTKGAGLRDGEQEQAEMQAAREMRGEIAGFASALSDLRQDPNTTLGFATTPEENRAAVSSELNFMSGEAGDELRSAAQSGGVAKSLADSGLQFMEASKSESNQVHDTRGTYAGSLDFEAVHARASGGSRPLPSALLNDREYKGLKQREVSLDQEYENLATQLKSVRAQESSQPEDQGTLQLKETEIKQKMSDVEYHKGIAKKDTEAFIVRWEEANPSAVGSGTTQDAQGADHPSDRPRSAPDEQ